MRSVVAGCSSPEYTASTSIQTNKQRARLSLFIAILLPKILLASRELALAYPCDVQHCYGVHAWKGGTDGADTGIYIVNMTSPDTPQAAFITNELWLVEFTGTNYYWVEAGEEARRYFSPNPFYFWAEQKPGYSFMRHLGGDVPAEDFGAYAHISITRSSSTSFTVLLESPGVYVTDDSMNNTM